MARIRLLKPGTDLFLAEGDNVIFPLLDSKTSPWQMRFVRSRRADLPQMERAGAISQLAIPSNAGVADCTHVRFFTGGVVGADWNFYGPRVTGLAHYLNVNVQPGWAITIRPLLRTDVAQSLNRLESIRVVDLKIRTPFIPAVRDVDQTLADAFESAQRVGDAQEVGLTLQPGNRGRQSRLAQGVVGIIRGLMSRELRGQVTRFVITGRNSDSGRLETLDLLKEYLVFEEEIVRINPSTRALDPTSAYKAIGRVHTQNRSVIDSAPTIF